MQEFDEHAQIVQIAWAAGVCCSYLLGGILFYHFQEEMDYVDSFYFVVVTGEHSYPQYALLFHSALSGYMHHRCARHFTRSIPCTVSYLLTDTQPMRAT